MKSKGGFDVHDVVAAPPPDPVHTITMGSNGVVLVDGVGVGKGACVDSSPLNRQVGGSHYKDYPIQPVVFATKNKLSFIVGTIIKYLCRYDKPTGKGLQDLEKCTHYIELLIEIEGWRKKDDNNKT